MNNKKLPLLFCVFFALAACRSGEEIINHDISVELNIVYEGIWKIDLFDAAGTDLTPQFNAHHFVFEKDQDLQLSAPNVRHTGRWTIDYEIDNQGNISDLTMDILFFGNAGLGDLVRLWNLVESNDQEIELVRDDDDGNSYRLIFKRI